MGDIVLVGGGHANLSFIKKHNQDRHEDTSCTLVSADRYQYYSGMFSGFLEGIYSLKQIRIDLQDFCKDHNVRFVCDKADRIDQVNKRVIVSSGQEIPYEVLSVNVGSHVQDDIPGAHDHALSLKPNFHFLEVVERIRHSPRTIIVGGGAAGVELMFSLHAWREKNELNSKELTLLTGGEVFEGEAEFAKQKIRRLFQKKQINLVEHERAEEMTTRFVKTNNGEYEGEAILWLAGPKPPPLIRDLDVKKSEGGFLLVTDRMQSVSDPAIFGAGDCITVQSYPHLPKNGVYAIRQANELYENVNRYLKGETLKTFTPQKRYLAILSTGHREGLLTYGKFSIHGKIPWLVKNRIDGSFMKTLRC
ncbi:FAD-dependent oxidoreductase [Alteribacter aurantiacus]|uniref:FAD-dependent oxidoreductase n=1 Tax=Alteribacter aurantiacus TaxID=254410 RepID=UPI00040B3636|nr:FAD-dependent oxidoreductase [Alteribacter aurantiacus]